jgi:hypothetical protein
MTRADITIQRPDVQEEAPMALSTLNAFLTGKAIALAASVALAGGGAAVVTTTVTTGGQAADDLATDAAAADLEDEPEDGDHSVHRAEGQQRADDARADLELADGIELDDLVPVIAPGDDAEEDGDDDRSGAVHAALTDDEDVNPADGAAFGAAVAENATSGREFGQSVAAAARGDNGPQDAPGSAPDTPVADAAAEGQARAAEARTQAGADDANDAVNDDTDTDAGESGTDDAKPTLPDAAADRAGNGRSNG